MPKSFKSPLVFALYFVLIPIISLAAAYTCAHIFPTAAALSFRIFGLSLLPAAVILRIGDWNIEFFNPGGDGIQIIPAFIWLLINFAFGFALGLAVIEVIRTFFPGSPPSERHTSPSDR